ncbi:dTDP-4-dehydrorhamnose 3,5-epimerase [Alphaproteobacteria bacterium]|nr:dTDP-4-dehydrorhamnose 3,5-epimerase [Alphaproteobacteria bacterium]MDC1085872.1 dTDP-4-dehydrorhamnose 3,5-epimerase [Alphaproteobacteria bacterium]
MIEDVIITQLDIIDTRGGNVMHAMKNSSAGYSKFGEAYFSQVHCGAIKAWKRHKKMVLNLVVPVGKIRFVLFDNRKFSSGQFQEVILSKDNYCRLTVPPMIWMGFQGLDAGVSLLLNIANIVHSPEESDRKPIESIKYEWG